MVDELINLGFKHKYFSTYELIGWGIFKLINLIDGRMFLKKYTSKAKTKSDLSFNVCWVFSLTATVGRLAQCELLTIKNS